MKLKIDKAGKLVVPEASIQKSCEELLQFDGWRIYRLEQNYSERKRKVIGEAGVPDTLAIRYTAFGVVKQFMKSHSAMSEVLWIEWKSAKGKPSAAQIAWHEAERKRGALTLIAGQDFPASIEGFLEWYRISGLNRRPI